MARPFSFISPYLVSTGCGPAVALICDPLCVQRQEALMQCPSPYRWNSPLHSPDRLLICILNWQAAMIKASNCCSAWEGGKGGVIVRSAVSETEGNILHKAQAPCAPPSVLISLRLLLGGHERRASSISAPTQKHKRLTCLWKWHFGLSPKWFVFILQTSKERSLSSTWSPWNSLSS